MRIGLCVLLLTSFASAQTIFISGTNPAAVSARKMMMKAGKERPKGCETFNLVGSASAAEYVLDVASDTDGSASGTLTKGGNIVLSDTYKSFMNVSSGVNGELLTNKFCRAVQKRKIR